MWIELISITVQIPTKTERKLRKNFRDENLGLLNQAAG